MGTTDGCEGVFVDVIQPDLCHAGGISEVKKIAAMAESYYVKVAPHNPAGADLNGGGGASVPCDPELPDPRICPPGAVPETAMRDAWW